MLKLLEGLGRKKTNAQILLDEYPWLWSILPSFRVDMPIRAKALDPDDLKMVLTEDSDRWWVKTSNPREQEVIEITARGESLADLIHSRLAKGLYFGPSWSTWKIEYLASCPRNGPTRHYPLVVRHRKKGIDIADLCLTRISN